MDNILIIFMVISLIPGLIGFIIELVMDEIPDNLLG
jgi:preprotein translocase subunit Sss1